MQSDKYEYKLKERGKHNSKYGKIVVLVGSVIFILSGIIVYLICTSWRGEKYLALVQNEDGKWGYINPDGEEVIPCQYDLAGSAWIDGVAMVAKKTGINESGEDTYKYGYINAKGEEVIPLQYDGASAAGVKVLAVAEATGKDENGNQILSWRFMNTKGEMITNKKYREIYYGDLPRFYKSKGVYVGELPSFYINTYDMSYYLGQQKPKTGYHIVKDDMGEDMEGVINEKGEEIIPLAMQEIVGEGEGLIAVGRENSNGDMKYGYVNYQNEIVIPLEYDYAYGFSNNGLGLVQKDEKWGYIDIEGNVVIDFQFDSAGPFEANGLAYVEEGKFINENGGTVTTVPEKYTIMQNNIEINRPSAFDLNGLAVVGKKTENGYLAGLVDSRWEERIACQYDSIGQFTSKGYVALNFDTDQTKYHLINSNLDLLEEEYDIASGFGENGWSAVGTTKDSLEDNQITYECWYVDEEGKTVLKLPENYIYSSNFSPTY